MTYKYVTVVPITPSQKEAVFYHSSMDLAIVKAKELSKIGYTTVYVGCLSHVVTSPQTPKPEVHCL